MKFNLGTSYRRRRKRINEIKEEIKRKDDFERYLKEQLKDPEFKKGWDNFNIWRFLQSMNEFYSRQEKEKREKNGH